MPSQATTLYAKWTINQATINFVGGGDSHSLAVSATGRVYAWGNNSNNELGDGTTTIRRTPTLISFTGLQDGETIQKVSAGQLHSLAVTTNGRVYAWGNNSQGQVGDGSTTHRSSPTLINFSGLLSGETIQTVVAGELHSLAVTTTGRVYAWGNGSSGQIGDGSNTNRSSPTLISLTGLQDGETVQKVLAGSYHSLAVTTNSRVYTWGSAGYGQLGNGTFVNRNSPRVIAFTGLQGAETIQDITKGNDHFLVVTSTGRLFAWGRNGDGQLGNGSTNNLSSPTLVSVSGLQSGETLQHVGAGAYHSFAVTTTGRLFVWGNNGSGQLGDGTIISKTTPTLVIVQ